MRESMEFSELIKDRKSVRRYQQKPVPLEVIEDILAVAKWSPSSMNTQPSHVHGVPDEPLDRIRRGNTENMVKGVPIKCDFPKKEACEGIHRKRPRWTSRFNCSMPWSLPVTTKNAAPIR